MRIDWNYLEGTRNGAGLELDKHTCNKRNDQVNHDLTPKEGLSV